MALDAPNRSSRPAPGSQALAARARATWALRLSVAVVASGCGAVGPEADPSAPDRSAAPVAAAVGTLASAAAPDPTRTEPPRADPGPAAAGALDSVAAVGTLPLGAACGGALGACDAAGFCQFPPEAACGEGGAPGVCTARPRGCRRDCPGVCGCAGERFCNTCSAQARGFSVRHRGACAPPASAPPEPAAPDPATPEPAQLNPAASTPAAPTHPEAAHVPQ